MYYVYVIQSQVNDRLYIGQTNNLERRLDEHNSGKSIYTKTIKPFTLLYNETFATRKEAVNREIELKSGKGREWLKAYMMTRAVALGDRYRPLSGPLIKTIKSFPQVLDGYYSQVEVLNISLYLYH